MGKKNREPERDFVQDPIINTPEFYSMQLDETRHDENGLSPMIIRRMADADETGSAPWAGRARRMKSSRKKGMAE